MLGFKIQDKGCCEVASSFAAGLGRLLQSHQLTDLSIELPEVPIREEDGILNNALFGTIHVPSPAMSALCDVWQAYRQKAAEVNCFGVAAPTGFSYEKVMAQVKTVLAQTDEEYSDAMRALALTLGYEIFDCCRDLVEALSGIFADASEKASAKGKLVLEDFFCVLSYLAEGSEAESEFLSARSGVMHQITLAHTARPDFLALLEILDKHRDDPLQAMMRADALGFDDAALGNMVGELMARGLLEYRAFEVLGKNGVQKIDGYALSLFGRYMLTEIFHS